MFLTYVFSLEQNETSVMKGLFPRLHEYKIVLDFSECKNTFKGISLCLRAKLSSGSVRSVVISSRKFEGVAGDLNKTVSFVK